MNVLQFFGPYDWVVLTAFFIVVDVTVTWVGDTFRRERDLARVERLSSVSPPCTASCEASRPEAGQGGSRAGR